MPDPVLGTGHAAVNKTGRVPVLTELTPTGRQTLQIRATSAGRKETECGGDALFGGDWERPLGQVMCKKKPKGGEEPACEEQSTRLQAPAGTGELRRWRKWLPWKLQDRHQVPLPKSHIPFLCLNFTSGKAPRDHLVHYVSGKLSPTEGLPQGPSLPMGKPGSPNPSWILCHVLL